MLELKNLMVKRGDLTVADHINVRFEEGKVYTVLGPNGTGKSSTAGGTKTPSVTGTQDPTTMATR